MLDRRTMIVSNVSRIRHRLLPVAATVGVLTALCFPAQAATPPGALVMAWNIDAISTFDPAQIGEIVTAEIVQNTCDSLVDFDPADERKPIPMFAESWDVSD